MLYYSTSFKGLFLLLEAAHQSTPPPLRSAERHNTGHTREGEEDWEEVEERRGMARRRRREGRWLGGGGEEGSG